MAKKQSKIPTKPVTKPGTKHPLIQEATYECGSGGVVTVSTGSCTNRFKPKRVYMCKGGHPCARPEEIAKSAK